MFGLSTLQAGAICLAIGFASGGFSGAKVMSWWWRSDQLSQERAANEVWRTDAIKLNQIAQKHVAEEQAHERIVYQPIFRTLTKVVDRPVYRSCAVDADGLQLLNAAIAGTPPAGREPDGTLSKRDAAGRAGDGGATPESRGAGSAPQPVR